MTEHVIQIAYLIATVLFILVAELDERAVQRAPGCARGELGMLHRDRGHPAASRTSSTTGGSPSGWCSDPSSGCRSAWSR